MRDGDLRIEASPVILWSDKGLILVLVNVQGSLGLNPSCGQQLRW